jgi:hypothetical protein
MNSDGDNLKSVYFVLSQTQERLTVCVPATVFGAGPEAGSI